MHLCESNIEVVRRNLFCRILGYVSEVIRHVGTQAGQLLPHALSVIQHRLIICQVSQRADPHVYIRQLTTEFAPSGFLLQFINIFAQGLRVVLELFTVSLAVHQYLAHVIQPPVQEPDSMVIYRRLQVTEIALQSRELTTELTICDFFFQFIDVLTQDLRSALQLLQKRLSEILLSLYSLVRPDNRSRALSTRSRAVGCCLVALARSSCLSKAVWVLCGAVV